MRGLRRRHGRHRRLGCFRLPTVPGASRVVEARRKDVGWLARTDIDSKEVEFSEHWDKLPADAKKYIVAHERAHLGSSEKHDAAFYAELQRICEKEGIPLGTPWKMETANLPQGPRRCRR